MGTQRTYLVIHVFGLSRRLTSKSTLLYLML